MEDYRSDSSWVCCSEHRPFQIRIVQDPCCVLPWNRLLEVQPLTAHVPMVGRRLRIGIGGVREPLVPTRDRDLERHIDEDARVPGVAIEALRAGPAHVADMARMMETVDAQSYDRSTRSNGRQPDHLLGEVRLAGPIDTVDRDESASIGRNRSTDQVEQPLDRSPAGRAHGLRAGRCRNGWCRAVPSGAARAPRSR